MVSRDWAEQHIHECIVGSSCGFCPALNLGLYRSQGWDGGDGEVRGTDQGVGQLPDLAVLISPVEPPHQSVIAAVLGALVTLAAEHRTQAQNVPGVIFADAFAPNPSMKSEEDQRDFGYVEGRYIGENSAGKISSADGSGGRRCEMSPEEFAKFYPPLLDWIRTTLIGSMHIAQTVASRGFSRLPLYFTENTLASTKVVLIDPLPMPPLSSMGLARFADFERGDFDASVMTVELERLEAVPGSSIKFVPSCWSAASLSDRAYGSCVLSCRAS
jgi:hypothetical protein